MINRASVPMWGIVGQSAGPAKWPGKKSDSSTKVAETVARIRFYLHKLFRAAEIRFYLHKEIRAAESWFYLHKEFRVAGIELYLHKEFLKKIHE